MSERKCPEGFIWDEALGNCVRKWDDSIINAEVNNGSNNTTSGVTSAPTPQGGEEEFDENRHVKFTREEVIRRAKERYARKLAQRQQQQQQQQPSQEPKPEARPEGKLSEAKPYNNPLVDVARQLHERGFNVIFVDRDKRPSGIERYADYYTQKMPPEAFEEHTQKAAGKATGIALLGNYNPEYPTKSLVIIDVDDPKVWQEKVLPNLPEGIRQKLESTWRWLTGPRCPRDGDKHNITCQNGKCRHGDHKFDLKDAPRGMAYAILAPANIMTDGTKKLMGGAVELRIRGYELIPPSLHPSGINYEWVNPAITNGVLQPIAELTSDEFRALINALQQQQQQPAQQAQGQAQAPQAHAVQKRLGSKAITDEQINNIINIFRKYNAYREGFRNNIHFYLQAWLLKACFSPDSVRELSRKLAEAFNDEEADERVELVDYQVKWLLEGRKALTEDEVEEIRKLLGKEPTVLKGRSGLVETLSNMFVSDGLSKDEAQAKALAVVSEVASALGIKSRRWIMIATDINFKAIGYREWLANVPGKGILLINRRINKTEYNECIDNGGSRDECLDRASLWGRKPIANCWIEGVRIYRDRVSDMIFYKIRVRGLGRRMVVDGTPEDVYRKLHERGFIINDVLFRTAQLNALAWAMSKKRSTYYATVLAEDDGKLRLYRHGKYAKSINLDVLNNMNLAEIARAINELFSFYPDKKKAMDAYAVGLFQIFTFVRKQYNLRNRALVLYGEKRTGKTTIALVIGEDMLNLPHGTYYKTASVLFSPARLGRSLQHGLVVLFDEGRNIVLNLTAADAFKNAVNDVKVYETAVAGVRDIANVYPAYSGMIITTQNFTTDDPGVQDRIYAILFTRNEVITPDKEEKFKQWRAANKHLLYAFGMLYIKTAIDEWDKVRDIILQGDFVKAAREYFAYVLSKLGIKAEYPEEEETTVWEEYVEESVVDKFKATVYTAVKDASMLLKDLSRLDESALTMDNIIKLAIDRDLLSPFGIKKVGDDRVRIHSEFVKKARINSLKNLYEHLVLRYGSEGIEYRQRCVHGHPCIEMDVNTFIGIVLGNNEDAREGGKEEGEESGNGGSDGEGGGEGSE